MKKIAIIFPPFFEATNAECVRVLFSPSEILFLGGEDYVINRLFPSFRLGNNPTPFGANIYQISLNNLFNSTFKNDLFEIFVPIRSEKYPAEPLTHDLSVFMGTDQNYVNTMSEPFKTYYTRSKEGKIIEFANAIYYPDSVIYVPTGRDLEEVDYTLLVGDYIKLKDRSTGKIADPKYRNINFDLFIKESIKKYGSDGRSGILRVLGEFM